MRLLLLALEFCKTGAFAAGGGLATLPFLYAMADRRAWFSREAVGNFLAVAGSAPGAIGVNLSVQAGFAAGGVPGALLAPAALILPAVAVITLAAKTLMDFESNKTVNAVFQGLRPAAAGLLASAGAASWSLFLFTGALSPWYGAVRWREAALFALFYAAVRVFKLHPAAYAAAGAVLGIVLGL